MSNLTVTTFTSTTGTRTLDFTTGNIIVSNNAGGSLVTTSGTSLTVTGATTGNGITVTNNSATATTVSMTGHTVSNAINLLVNIGTYALTLAASSTIRSLNFTGFSGSIATNIVASIFGGLTLASLMTAPPAGTNTWTFGATTSETITSAGKTMDFPVTFNGAGGTYGLSDAMTVGSTRTLTLTNGTIDLNGFTLSTGLFATAAGTKSLVFDGGTLTISGSGATAFNNAVPAGFTASAGTGNGTISLTSATAKTFVGGGVTYPATLSQAGAGTLTISGNNTFQDIIAPITATSAATIIFPLNGTVTVNQFTASGQSTRPLTLTTSNPAVTGAAEIYSPTGLTGFISGADWLIVQGIAFTPSALDGTNYIHWFIGANSTMLNCVGAVAQNYSAGTSPKVYVLEVGTVRWIVPSDFNTANNFIHIFGAGAGGSGFTSGGGGGYSKITNATLYSGQTVFLSVGSGGTPGNDGGNTYFGTTFAYGGASIGGAGGTGLTYNGGSGAQTPSGTNRSGSGGGGAAGSTGNGANGTAGISSAAGIGGSGGAGASGGTSGATAVTTSGGNGGNNALGAGGGAGSNGTAAAAEGTQGGGGGGGSANASFGDGARGGQGTDILNTFGGGGGGGGGGVTTTTNVGRNGGAGGKYGGGGGGAGLGTSTLTAGTGGSGVIIIQYVPGTAPTPPGSSGSMLLVFT